MGLTANLKDVAWRAMTAYDLKAVEEIAAAVHPTLFESHEVLAERQQLYRNGCYLLEIGVRPAGYVLSHPWKSGTLPPLNMPLGRIPEDAGTYYLHDLALLPMARRIGAASHIVAALIKHAEVSGFRTMSLVAVSGSQGFWERHGFVPDDRPGIEDKLKSYDSAARFMVRPLRA